MSCGVSSCIFWQSPVCTASASCNHGSPAATFRGMLSTLLVVGDLTDAAHWQKLLEQLVAQLAPPLATHKPTPLGPPSTLSSPEHASSDMIISPPPVPLASHLSPHRKQSPARSRGSPVRSRGSPAGRSPAGSSPRLLALGRRPQKRSASTLRPR